MPNPSRRRFLKGTLLSLSSVLLNACGSTPPSAAPNQPTAAVVTPLTAPSAGPTADPTATVAKTRDKTPTTAPAQAAANTDTSVILGRPTDHVIALNYLPAASHEVFYEYGTGPGSYLARTPPQVSSAGTPLLTEITGLQPDTRYFYRAVRAGSPTAEHSFQTRRAPGSSFCFTLDADPHNRDPNFDGSLYAAALDNARLDQPDFHINLGDTFMTEKLKPQTLGEAEATFRDLRPYFGRLAADAPLFLVNGNHEGELGWLLRGADKDLPRWCTQLRQQYYPNPTPGTFYSGSTSSDPTLGRPRDGYYAWNWGDALFVVLDPFWYTTSKPQANTLNSNWNWTLGREQYDWLKTTLSGSPAKFKFVCSHHLVGGASEARGGIESAGFFEWGGKNAGGSPGFTAHRPGWGRPIHDLLVENRVTLVFHGHDHVFVRQELDGIVYQEMPQPNNPNANNTRLAADYGYTHGNIVGGSGHLRVNVQPHQVTVAFVRAAAPNDKNFAQNNRQVAYTYTLP